MSQPHCFGDKQYTSNRDLYHHQIRRESDRFGRIYVCGTPPPPSTPPPIYMTPGHRIGGEPSGLVGYVYPPPPTSPSLSIHITPGLKPTSD